jgi:hypothetical protein
MLCGTRILTDPRWRRLYRTITRGVWAREGSKVNARMLIVDRPAWWVVDLNVVLKAKEVYVATGMFYATMIVSEPTKRLPIQHGGCQLQKHVVFASEGSTVALCVAETNSTWRLSTNTYLEVRKYGNPERAKGKCRISKWPVLSRA